MTKSLTTVIGRFSLFHNGHAHLIDRAVQTSDFLLILIGSSGQVRTIKNPFTFTERAAVIVDYVKSEYPNAIVRIDPPDDEELFDADVLKGIIIKPLRDHMYNDLEWINEVQEKVITTKNLLSYRCTIAEDVYLTGADRDESTWYLKAFGGFFKSDLITESPHGLELNATALRDELFSTNGQCLYRKSMGDNNLIHRLTPRATIDFLYDFAAIQEFQDLVQEYQFIKKYKDAWKSAPYAPIFVTVDTCVIQSGHILVNVRDNYPGRGLWALPGGFLEQDEKMVDGAIRELIEETSIELSKAQLYGSIKAQQVFDAPDRSLRGRTITQCFLLKLDDSKPLPKVKPQKGEVKKLMWLPINEALSNTDKWFEDHLCMVKWSLGQLNS